MSRNISYLLLIIGMLMFNKSFSQKRKKEPLHNFLTNISPDVDANVKEWDNKFFNIDSENWQCAIAVHENKLYAAVVVKNEALQIEALRSGITWNISYTDKHKDGAMLVFPGMDRESLRALKTHESDTLISKADLLKRSRGYLVKGFSKVVDGLLSFENDYGIQAVANIDNGVLIYEAVIPLDLIKFDSKTIASQLLVNTQYRQMQKVIAQNPVRNIGIYGNQRPVTVQAKNPYSEKIEIWATGAIK